MFEEARRDPTGLSEKEWQQAILDYAKLRGWLSFHVFDSRRSTPGYPDVTFVRRGRLVFAELKREGEKPTGAQVVWLDALRACFGVEVFLWRPSDLDAVINALR
jgi:hypothetical protein